MPRNFAACLLALIPVEGRSAAPTPDVGAGMIQMLAGLAVVVALIFASLWLLKRLSVPRGAAAGMLRVIAGTAVGPRERVVLVELGETWLVLGVAPGGVRMLHQTARLETVAAATAAAPAKSFSAWLKEVSERRDARR